MIIAHANKSAMSYDDEENTSKLEMDMVLFMEVRSVILKGSS